MSIRSSVAAGFRRVYRTPRLVLFAWFVQLLLALMVALPMFSILDSYIGGTIYEEPLLHGMDQNWWSTFKADNAQNPIVDMLDYSVIGVGTFFSHAEAVLQGGIVVPAARFLTDLLFGMTVSWSGTGILVMVGMIAIAINALLAAGFITTYRGDYPPTITEFLASGAGFFGAFIRLSVLVFLLQALLLYPVLREAASLIASGTQNDASEMTPFLYYMGRNVVALVLFFLVSLIADYARVIMVVDRRNDAISAFIAGGRFVFSHLRVTIGIGSLLLVCTVVAMSIYGLLEPALPKHTGALIFLLFILQQFYMIVRQALRASAYACEVDVFQHSGIPS